MIRIRRGYAAGALAVFATELFIALFVRDSLVRPLVGDSLAVVLVYLTVRALTGLRRVAAVALALGAALAVELGQLLDVIGILGLSDNRMAGLVLGARFDPLDLIAYLGGALCIAAGEALAGRMGASRTAGKPR